MIDCHGEPPAKRPDLRQCEEEPRNPEAQGGGEGGQIDVPEVIWLFCAHDPRRRLRNLARLGPPCIPLHSANCGRPEVETRAGEDLGGFHVPEGGAEDFQAPHDVTDELGKSIDRFGQLNERVGPLLVEPGYPGGDRERAHLKDLRHLGE